MIKKNVTLFTMLLLLFASILSYAQSDLAASHTNDGVSGHQTSEVISNSNYTPNAHQNPTWSDEIFSVTERSRYSPKGGWNIPFMVGPMENNSNVSANTDQVASSQLTGVLSKDTHSVETLEVLLKSDTDLFNFKSNCLSDFYLDDVMSGLVYYCCHSLPLG